MAYDLLPLSAPRLAGTPLRLFTLALESPLLRWALLPRLLRDNGFEAFRARTLEEPPQVVPSLPVVGTALAGEPASDFSALASSARPGRHGHPFETVSDFVAAYREGHADPIAVADRLVAAMDEADAREPAMRLFIARDRDDLVAQARASAARHREGRPLGPLDGVPVAVKDELDQLPYPTTLGTCFRSVQPSADATVVARLRAAGALLPGKAAMHEIGIGVTGLNPHTGTPRNPYEPGHFTGGSSSGPAAAVAAGLCPIAIGADGGGSIRTPAAFCGVVGLKATWGRVSEKGVAPLVWSMGHVGPLGATARDCAIGYSVIAGPDPQDPRTAIQPAPRIDGVEDPDLRGVRIGVFRPWFEDADDDVVRACRATLDRLVASGAQVVEVEVEELELARVAHVVTIVSEMATGMAPEYRANRARFGLDVRINLALGLQFDARDYVRAQQARTRVTRLLAEVLDRVDVLATPTTGCAAPAIRADALRQGESDLATLGRIMRFASLANLTGYPAISFPAGYTEAGLPIGFMALGRPWDERLLLRLAHVSELGLDRLPPRVHFRLLDR